MTNVSKTLKTIISKPPALVPFNPKFKIVLQCDASKNGLGCCMFQEHEDDILKLVACASRNMNDHEINYSQTEKELLAIYFGTQKFHNFIYNFEINVQSDHKPIISIMKKPVSKIGSVRLQRLRLKLLKYSLNIYYVPGKDIHFADMLSRSTLKQTSYDPEMLEMVHLVTKYLPMSEEKKTEFRVETSKDETLSKIFDFYYNGWPKEKFISDKCKPYYKIRDYIYIEAGIVFFNDKIIVPESLRLYIIKLLHKGHIGISKTINKARTLFFWPELNTDITSFIKTCRICEKFMPSNYKEPLLPHSVPTLRFNKIGTDILEYSAKSFLVIIDYFSHWLEVILLKDKTSNSVINAFQDIFTKFGYPQFVIADNLPFISNKCKSYYRDKDITILTCTPHYHQSNGLAEKSVSIAKQILKKGAEDNNDYRDLVMEYNNTCIVSLNASPAQILQSRNLRSQLPLNNNQLEPKIQIHIYTKLVDQKKHLKLHYDKKVRKSPTEFKKGDKVVIKSSKDQIWHKGIILEKANEPRSYWVRKENNNKIVRRNSSQMKLSFTILNQNERILEPELYPFEQSQPSQPRLQQNFNLYNDINLIPNIPNVSPINKVPKSHAQSHIPVPSDNVNIDNHKRVSSFGRTVKAPPRLNL